MVDQGACPEHVLKHVPKHVPGREMIKHVQLIASTFWVVICFQWLYALGGRTLFHCTDLALAH